MKTLLIVWALAAGLAAAPAIYAHDPGGSDGSMMGRGMMGTDGMMGIMGQMSSMLENCNEMMQAMKDSENGGQRPNEQWRERSPQPGSILCHGPEARIGSSVFVDAYE